LNNKYIPYGKQQIDDADIEAVVAALKSDWLTTGPMVESFEKEFADYTGAKHAVALSSGTAALHALVYAAGIGPGDEVIVPAITFAATANAVVYQGGTPVFCDVSEETLLINPEDVKSRITPKTKAIIAVDYAGQPCDYDSLTEIAGNNDILLYSDACHALGSSYRGKKQSEIVNMATFSFHPVKHITTGEGGMVITSDEEMASKMRAFRNHGISTDYKTRESEGTYFYEMVELGYNYRLTDIQSALGLSQLKKLDGWIQRRREIAAIYNSHFAKIAAVELLAVNEGAYHVYHLYVIKLRLEELSADRLAVFKKLREQGLGVNVHYLPVHLHPYYRENFGTYPGICPKAEEAYRAIISLPLYAGMTDEEVEKVIEVFSGVIESFRKG